MPLPEMCKAITVGEKSILPDGHDVGTRLVCPEYSRSVQEVKTYPLLGRDQLFVLCWCFDGQKNLYAAMKPYPTPFCCRYTFRDGEKTQLHTHEYLELAYVVEGNFRQKILGKDIVFHEGELCLIDKNCVHQDYLMDCPGTVLFFGLSNEMFDEIMTENVTTRKISFFLQSALMRQKNLQQYLHFKPSPPVCGEMERCLVTLLEELQADDAASRHICKGMMIRIFRLLSTRYEFSLSRGLRRAMNWVVFEEITDYIKNHYASITIQDLVNTFHFQEDYFNRLIKLKAGVTYSEYVKQLRLAKAEQLLLSTDLNIDEIAEAVGYHNKGYFYKIFRERYGMTPYRLRKKGSV